HLDKLTLQPIPDETQRLATLQSNDKALMYTPSGVTATQAIDAGFDTTRVPRSGGFVLMFNMRKAPFDDLRARQAFSYALDTEEITTAIIGDAVPWVTNIFDETSPFYDESLAQPDADDA